jgi:putative addiction module killer protein
MRKKPMNTINRTRAYVDWFRRLNDRQAKERILVRVRRAIKGNFGDSHPAGGGVSEMRVDYGPGYRIYYAQEGKAVYLLLLGGDKRGQENDIGRAKAMWRAIQEKRDEKGQ